MNPDELHRIVNRASYRAAIADAQQVIASALETYGEPAVVAVSGGKDSVAMAHLVSLQCRPAILWNDSGLELPESGAVVRALADLLGLPLVVARGNATEEGATDESAIRAPSRAALRAIGARVEFVGLRAEESRRRRMVIAKYGPHHVSPSWGCGVAWPMRRWRAADSLAYIEENGLPLHPAYRDTIWARREDVRTSWAYDEDRISVGEAEIVRRKYPELFRKLREAGRCQ